MLNIENIIIILSLNNHSNLNPYNRSSREIISVLLDNDLRSLILSPLRRMMFYSKSSHTAHSPVSSLTEILEIFLSPPHCSAPETPGGLVQT